MKKGEVLILTGPAGCGKGSTLKALFERLPGKHKIIGTGDRCRDEITRQTDIGKIIKSRNDLGLLVPDRIMVPIIEEEMRIIEGGSGLVVLDGAARTEAQYQAIRNRAALHSCSVHTVFIDDPIDECSARILNDSSRTNRTDSSENIVRVRMCQFEDYTLPAIECARGHEGFDFLHLKGVPTPSAKAGHILAFIANKYPDQYSIGKIVPR